MSAPDPDTDEIRRRQRARAIVMGLALGGFVILLYFITIARMGAQ
ncbi:hypothetical protein [Sphingosinicella sp. CPCC 101087]|jgi:hypothetical protein|nr:hypothetical protein [Sphingosinicella sp. CPCC 101087]